jgi:hypothetical protein
MEKVRLTCDIHSLRLGSVSGDRVSFREKRSCSSGMGMMLPLWLALLEVSWRIHVRWAPGVGGGRKLAHR